jgi:uncharacterized protein (DUF1800 family)
MERSMHSVKYFRAMVRAALFGLAALVLGACGSGSDSTPPPSSGPEAQPTTQAEASRFLVQASFGANMSSVADLSANGYAIWLDQQFAMPAGTPHQNYLVSVIASLPAGQSPQDSHVTHTFWKQAATAPDQLRQRVAFALSQIVVFSLTHDAVSE